MCASPDKRPVDMISHSIASPYRTRVDGKPQDGCFREKPAHSAMTTYKKAKTSMHMSLNASPGQTTAGRAH